MQDQTGKPLVEIDGLRFAWPGEPRPLLVIDRLSIAPGERLFLRGPSGSGKSTLLGLIAGVLEPSAGHIHVCGAPMHSLNAARRDKVRADHLGIVFQLFNLLPYLGLIDNVTLPVRFSVRRRRALTRPAAEEAKRLLAALGLDDPALLKRRTLDLSVGQQQRVAAARALIGAPDLVIADEPTSALDSDARDRFIELLKSEAEASGAALLFVSHDAALAGHFDRAVDLREINQAVEARA